MAGSSHSLELLHLDTLRVPERKPSPLPTRGLIPGRSQKQAGRGWWPRLYHPDVRGLLEILIAKRVGLKSWKEKEKDEEAGYHLNSLGKRIESLGHKQDTLGHQHVWNTKGKHDQLLGPEKPRYPDTLGDRLQKTCSQLFWGLPLLHSESLVAAVTVPGSALELCPVLFNELSKAKPFHIPAKVISQLSLAKHLTHPVAQAQPQSLTPIMPQLQPSPLGHM